MQCQLPFYPRRIFSLLYLTLGANRPQTPKPRSASPRGRRSLPAAPSCGTPAALQAGTSLPRSPPARSGLSLPTRPLTAPGPSAPFKSTWFLKEGFDRRSPSSARSPPRSSFSHSQSFFHAAPRSPSAAPRTHPPASLSPAAGARTRRYLRSGRARATPSTTREQRPRAATRGPLARAAEGRGLRSRALLERPRGHAPPGGGHSRLLTPLCSDTW